MVRGLDIFREHFEEFSNAYVLIGGAACHEWFAAQELVFRATKDLDILLLIEIIDHSFVAALRAFIEKGGYDIRQRTQDGPPILYRFAKPKDPDFPAMLELFCRKPEQINLGDGQEIVPIPSGEDSHSLSAILLDENYYSLIVGHKRTVDGVVIADAAALIPLKAHAWLNLTERKERGEKIDSKDIDKHRNDVFRLAGTLPGEPGPTLPAPILADLKAFLDQFPADSPHWKAILASIKDTLGAPVEPESLRQALTTYFRLK